jgi:protein-disulfide isomerase-like protein with CxxC motif
MNTPEYLDAVKRHLGISSDYALAKKLGFSQSAMSSYRTGRRVFDDDAALTVAQALGLNPLVVIAAANAERAKTPEQKARWSGLMDKLSVSFNTLLTGSWSGVERRRDYSRRLAHAR